MSGPLLPSAVAERVAALRARLVSAGGAGVRLVAATKGMGVDSAAAALDAGVTDLAESYAQELAAKSSAMADLRAGSSPTPRWHFVGRLQSNKVRSVARVVGLWQSVDRAVLVDEIARRAPGAAILVQVALDGPAGRGGCPAVEVPALVARAGAAGLRVEGLMAGPAGLPGDRGAARRSFRLVASLADELGLAERSMGMTDDLELAVEEGATMVRVGRGLFGERPRGPAAGPLPS